MVVIAHKLFDDFQRRPNLRPLITGRSMMSAHIPNCLLVALAIRHSGTPVETLCGSRLIEVKLHGGASHALAFPWRRQPHSLPFHGGASLC